MDKDLESPPLAFDPVLTDSSCPKCGMEMEPIERGAAEPLLERLQLCPRCYLVTWLDEDGLHLRQGVPMKDGVPVNPSASSDRGPTWMAGEPQDC